MCNQQAEAGLLGSLPAAFPQGMGFTFSHRRPYHLREGGTRSHGGAEKDQICEPLCEESQIQPAAMREEPSLFSCTAPLLLAQAHGDSSDRPMTPLLAPEKWAWANVLVRAL